MENPSRTDSSTFLYLPDGGLLYNEHGSVQQVVNQAM